MVASAPEYGKYADELLTKQMKPEILTEIRALDAKKINNPRNY
jgi:proline iminopeptidase